MKTIYVNAACSLELYSIKLRTGRLRPEVQILYILYIIYYIIYFMYNFFLGHTTFILSYATVSPISKAPVPS